MKVAVWDTYVTKQDGKVMHFDIIAPTEQKDEKIIHEFGKQYLQTKGQAGQAITSKECRFCHIEEASEEIKAGIANNGYYILEMQGY